MASVICRSNPDTYIVKCVLSCCPGKVRAQRFPGAGTAFRITVVTDHTCELQEPLQMHKNVTSAYIASIISHVVVADLTVSPKVLMANVANTVGYAVSYSKVWRAKRKVLEGLYGTYKEAYDLVPRMLKQIADANPGTCVNRVDRPDPSNNPHSLILDRVFWAFGPAVQGFSHCRPVLTMDGTFLCGKYKGTILTAIAADGNDQLLPVAFAIVENENTDSWLWFLVNIKQRVVRDRPNVCVITDRHAGLLSALRTMQHGTSPPYQWNDMRTRWCMRHVAANFHTRFRSKDLMKKFKKLCLQNQKRKFDAVWRELEVETERASGGSGPGAPQSEFAEWMSVHAPDYEKWSLLHDTYGARYGIMTTNMSEVYNGVLKGVRALPITAVVDETWNRTVGYFVNRAMMAKQHFDEGKQYSEVTLAYMDKKITKARSHVAITMDGVRRKFEVRLRDKYVRGHMRGDRKHVCTIGDVAVCTCNKPQLLHKPCSHVYAACAVFNQSCIMYMSEYYDIRHLYDTWNGEFNSYGVECHYRDIWRGAVKWSPNEALRHPGRGRRQSRRIRNDMDASQRGDRPRPIRCRLCKTHGHSFGNCPNRPSSSGAT